MELSRLERKGLERLKELRVRALAVSPTTLAFFNEPKRIDPALSMQIRQAVIDIAPSTEFSTRLEKIGRSWDIDDLTEVLSGLINQIECGYHTSTATLAHAEVFGDIFDSAVHLVESGYKVPAVVISGVSLEAHLRLLAQQNGIETSAENGRSKSASSLNDELAKKAVYDKTQQKLITAWQDMRNAAAHGTKTNDEFDESYVRHMIEGVALFISRFPA